MGGYIDSFKSFKKKSVLEEDQLVAGANPSVDAIAEKPLNDEISRLKDQRDQINMELTRKEKELNDLREKLSSERDKAEDAAQQAQQQALDAQGEVNQA